MTRLILILLPLVLPAYVVRFRIGPLPTTVLEIFLLGFLVAWALTRKKEGWDAALKNIRKRKWLLPLSLWLASGLIGVIVAPDHIAALGLWRAYFLEPALIFFMLNDLVRDDADKRVLLRSLSATLALLALWAIGQFIGILPIPTPWNAPPSGIRATGPFPFPNALALFAVPAAALFFHLFTRRPTVWPLMGFLSGGIVTLLAKSDGGLIALVGAGFLSLVTHKKTRLAAIIAALAISALAFAHPVSRDVLKQQFLFQEWSGKVRLVMWKETREMLKDNAVVGVGLGAYQEGIAPYHKATWMEIFQYPHNILLNLWSEVGLLGILAFGWILVAWARNGRGNHVPALAVIAAILIHGIVDVPYFKNDLAVLFWILVALTSTEPTSNA